MGRAFTGFANAKRRNWQPYNPNAERDARIEAEGLYTDPSQRFTFLDDNKDKSNGNPVAPILIFNYIPSYCPSLLV